MNRSPTIQMMYTRTFRSKKEYCSIQCVRFQLRVLSQGLVLFIFVSFVLMNTNTIPDRHLLRCNNDVGFFKTSLEDIQSGIAKPSLDKTFSCILNANRTCLYSSEVFLLILVKSAVGHFRKRRYIRETWGKDARKRGIKLVFLLGSGNEDDKFIHFESRMHGDLIQHDFEDIYENNTKKIKMALLWIKDFCTQAKNILIVDDDMYVNIQNSMRFIKERSRDKYLYSGYLIERPLPNRDPNSKHYISEARYPCQFYPPYVAGGGIFLNQHTVQMFVRVMPFIPEIPFDDVYIGFLALKLMIKPYRNTLIRLNDNLYDPGNVNEIQHAIAQHGYENDNMFHVAYYRTHYNQKYR